MTYGSRVTILWDVPLVLAFCMLLLAAGERILRILLGSVVAPNAFDRWQRGVVAFAVGSGVLQYLAYVLGMIGILGRVPVAVGLIVLTLILWRDLMRVGRALTSGSFQLLKSLRTRPLFVLACVLLALPLTMMLLHALSPPTGNDDLGYHLNAPRRWLEFGRLSYLPTFVNTQGPMGMEMLYTALMAIAADTTAQVFNFAVGIVWLISLAVLARRLGNINLALVVAAILLFCTGPNTGIDEFSRGMVEMGMSLQLVAAFLCFSLWMEQFALAPSDSNSARPWLWLSAFCTGVGATFKLTGIAVALTLAMYAGLMILVRRRGLAKAIVVTTIYIGVALLPLIPWFVRSWMCTGNPIYPNLASVFPSRDWSVTSGKAIIFYFKYYNWGWNGRLAQLGLTQRQELIDVTVAAFLLCAIGACFICRRQDQKLLAVVGSLLLALDVFSMGFAPRMAMPLAVPFLFAALIPTSRFWRSYTGQIATVVMMGFFSVVTFRHYHTQLKDDLLASTGSIDRWTYLERERPDQMIWRYVNSNIPKGDLIVVNGFYPGVGLTHGGTYYADRLVLVTDFYQQYRYRMDTWEHFVEDLKHDNVRYIIVPNAHSLPFIMSPGYPPADNEVKFGWEIARKRGVLIYSDGYRRMYRLTF